LHPAELIRNNPSQHTIANITEMWLLALVK
jgi:hypothetical protein